MNFMQRILHSSLMGLIYKEARHTLRDKHLLFLLIFPPTLQLFILGAALDVGVKNVPFGVVDYCQSERSHLLLSSIENTGLFNLQSQFLSEQELANAINKTQIKIGLVIPRDFDHDLDREHVTKTPVLIDGTDAYTARVARGYLVQIFQHFDAGIERPARKIVAKLSTLFNPDLISSWYFVPGVIGAMLTLTSTLVSSASLLREKESGTLEQLLMTPYSVAEILFAKVVPVFFLLMCDVFLALGMALVVFHLPLMGNLILFLSASALYVLVGMALGILMATVCKTERQAHLVSFFVNIPVMQLSGAVVPFDTMPEFLRQLASIDPLRYYTLIVRSIFLKGTDLDGLMPCFMVLAASTVVLFSLSLLRFRHQLN